MTVVQDLQQNVENVVMRLFNLIKEDDGIRMSSHLLRELAALLISDITGCGADDLGDSILLHVLGHIDPDQVLLGAEHRSCQRLRELGFADTGGTQKQE